MSQQENKNKRNRISKTLVFFSVDLSGSTRIKDSLHVHHHKPVWLEPFEQFFRDFPEKFLTEINLAFSGTDASVDVYVWKLVGDEIIFKCEPKSVEDAARAVTAFHRTIVGYDQALFERWPLRVKGTVWAAAFLERNIEINIPERMHWKDSDQAIHTDYLGPDVDAGFRISQHAPAGGVIVSVNLAEALAKVSDEFGLNFHYVGREVLKGVFSGRPYPLIVLSLPECTPNLWEWEETENDYAKMVLEKAPLKPLELIQLAEKIRTYLNRMCHLQLEPLKF
jgi:hypothetical protein